jgi:hypothetical protein
MERSAGMARTERKRRIEVSSSAVSNSAQSIDHVVKSLIDELIVPRLVEEFLRKYGPKSPPQKGRETLDSRLLRG